MAIKFIIFDFDGVLVDSEYWAAKTLEQNLIEAGAPQSLDDILRQFVGVDDITQREILDKTSNIQDQDAFWEKVKNDTFTCYQKELKPFDHVEYMLQNLNLPYAIGSNSRFSSVQRKLEMTSLNRYFSDEQIYVGAMVDRPKPYPDLYLHIAKLHNVDPSECLVIEDSNHGTEAAIAAKMNVIGFIGASHCYDGYEKKLTDAGAEIIFDDMRELSKIIRSFD